ncbi:hypothetical protein AOLI_G00002960 [Acnodon oligacanthus]
MAPQGLPYQSPDPAGVLKTTQTRVPIADLCQEAGWPPMRQHQLKPLPGHLIEWKEGAAGPGQECGPLILTHSAVLSSQGSCPQP